MAVRTSSMERHAVAHLQADETAVPGSNLTVENQSWARNNFLASRQRQRNNVI